MFILTLIFIPYLTSQVPISVNSTAISPPSIPTHLPTHQPTYPPNMSESEWTPPTAGVFCWVEIPATDVARGTPLPFLPLLPRPFPPFH
jgi:hypothetical protein